MAWNVTILHNSSCIVVVNEILFLSLAALQSLNSHYSSASPSDPSPPWKQLSIISGLCHTHKKVCSTSLMVCCGWCGKDIAQMGGNLKKYLRISQWYIQMTAERRVGNKKYIMYVARAPEHKLEFAAALFCSQSPWWNNPEATAAWMRPLTSWFSTPGKRLLSPLNVLR